MYWISACTAVAVLIGIAADNTVASAHEVERPDVTDPYAHVPAHRYRPVMLGYQPTPIMTEPGNWRELNDRAEQIGGPRGQLRDVNEPIRKRKKK